jgi:hypothetical protein
MRKTYAKPTIEIEIYQLSASIAANCQSIVNVGPGIPGADPESEFRMCDDYYKGGSGFLSYIPGLSIQSGNTPFYENGAVGCDCYHTSGGMYYFTS